MKTNKIKNIRPKNDIDLSEILLEGVDESTANLQLPDPDLLTYYKDLQNRTIWLDDEVTMSSIDLGKLILHWNREDAGIPVEERKPIKFLLFTPGGTLDSCFNLISIISLSKTPVYTYNMGLAMSAGFLLLLAGHKRFTLDNATALMHSGSGGTKGTYDQVQAQQEDYKHSIDYMYKFIEGHTKLTKKMLTKMKKDDTYFYADDMIEYGIVDKVIDNIDEIL